MESLHKENSQEVEDNTNDEKKCKNSISEKNQKKEETNREEENIKLTEETGTKN